MSRRKLNPTTKFPLETTQVARFLVCTYCEFGGEIAKHAAGQETYCDLRDARRAKEFAADVVRLLGHTLDPSRL